MAFGQTGGTRKPVEGLTLRLTSLEGDKPRASEARTDPNVWLFVSAGESPAPFLPAGKFSATWTGFIFAELRSDYFFQAEVSGALKLEINGHVVFEAAGAGAASPLSKSVRLNKGANGFQVAFISPDQGDAFVRLAWTDKEKIPSVPIPSTLFTHAVDPELEKYDKLRLGRELFVEHRCAKCHALASHEATPELAMDAPTFEGIGSRRYFAWMAEWILDPKAQRPTAHMPKLLHGAKAKEDAEAIAAFLASLKSDAKSGDLESGIKLVEGGKMLAEKLHCVGCHNLPDTPAKDSKNISLAHVNLKFAPPALVAFLKNPGAHYAWTRMPNFKLTDEEASSLAAYLSAGAPTAKQAAPPDDAGTVKHGKKLVQSAGCLNCHGLKLDNEFKAKTLAGLPLEKWNQGCLAAKRDEDSKAPDFAFTPTEREALQAFGATDRASLTRHAPIEFAERQARLLNCRACHGQLDGFPPLEILGGKLKPEWTAKFIAGEIPYKPRAEKHPKGEPWLEARMPAFKAPAEWLAQGLAMQHGFAPRTAQEPSIDAEAAKIGEKLVGKAGGYSCISCHGVGPMEAKEVFESEGINLAYSAERLLRPYFQRWVRDPLSIDPQTKMPKYFEDGKSPLTDFYDGDAEKQIDAIWQYLRLGDKMPPPNTGE